MKLGTWLMPVAAWVWTIVPPCDGEDAGCDGLEGEDTAEAWTEGELGEL